MATHFIPFTLAWLIGIWLASRIALPTPVLGVATIVAVVGIVLTWRAPKPRWAFVLALATILGALRFNLAQPHFDQTTLTTYNDQLKPVAVEGVVAAEPDVRDVYTNLRVEVGGVKIVHLGDSGPITQPDVLAAIGNADVLLANIDGYVIPSDQIVPFMQQAKVRTIIPAHYSLSEGARWQGAPTIDEFENPARRSGSCENGQRDSSDTQYAQTGGRADAPDADQIAHAGMASLFISDLSGRDATGKDVPYHGRKLSG